MYVYYVHVKASFPLTARRGDPPVGKELCGFLLLLREMCETVFPSLPSQARMR